jgi:hypothetical protein
MRQAVLLTAASLALAGCGAESQAAGSSTVKIGVLAPIPHACRLGAYRGRARRAAGARP